eukprot:548761_1
MAEAAKNVPKRTPHFEWCQDMDRLLIKILLSDVKVAQTKLDITRDTFSFQYKDYLLNFNFRFPVNPKTIKYRSTRVLELIIEKDSSNAYWPHLLPKVDKKKLKNHCRVDWNRFLDEDEAEKRQKGVVDDDDEYGNLNFGGGDNDDSSSDDSDDRPIDSLEDNIDEKSNENNNSQNNDDETDDMPPLENENDHETDDKNKDKVNDNNDDTGDKNKDKVNDNNDDTGDKNKDKVNDNNNDDTGVSID